jgi:hypothetical protein
MLRYARSSRAWDTSNSVLAIAVLATGCLRQTRNNIPRVWGPIGATRASAKRPTR